MSYTVSTAETLKFRRALMRRLAWGLVYVPERKGSRDSVVSILNSQKQIYTSVLHDDISTISSLLLHRKDLKSYQNIQGRDNFTIDLLYLNKIRNILCCNVCLHVP